MRTVLHIFAQVSIPYIILVAVIGIAGNFLTILMLAKRTLSKNFNNCTLIALGKANRPEKSSPSPFSLPV